MAGRIVTWKIVVAGEGGVGKTSTVVQACQSHFVDTYDPTLEDCHTRPLIVDGQPCVADFLDTAGEETYSALRDQWYRDADAIMILYSISSRSSFNRVKRFNDAILAARAQPQHPVRSGCKPLSPAGHDLWKIPPRILVGNKDDQEDTYREVSFQEGEALARELGIGFVESSATNAEKTMKPVHDLVQEFGSSCGGRRCCRGTEGFRASEGRRALQEHSQEDQGIRFVFASRLTSIGP
ncbi:ras-2 protein [Thelonectria olida]|uniref:Ras-2 protein n=1 Tax=Thelonectria olida TaxID=1576542 RepID=A0A9P9AFV5_9HYPO|nr:ras-2 protein [Thelonectria olida]